MKNKNMKLNIRNKFGFSLVTIYACALAVFVMLDCTGAKDNLTSMMIGGGMMAIVGLIFAYVGRRFAKIDAMVGDFQAGKQKIEADASGKNGTMKPESYQLSFASPELAFRYDRYQKNVMKYLKRGMASGTCQIEDYINEEMINQIAAKPVLNQIAGLMTGLGILGTFIGLSIGLKDFNLGSDTQTLMDGIAPLMDGIKVAFHTSIYGMILSLLFNFFYKKQMEETYLAAESFLEAYHGYVEKNASSDTEVFREILKTQETMALHMSALSSNLITYNENLAKQNQEFLNTVRASFDQFMNAASDKQLRGIEKIMNSFMEKLELSMEIGFEDLGKGISTCFDKELAQITKHLSGTLAEVAVTIDQVPGLIDHSYANMEKIFEDFQKDLEAMIHCLDLEKEICDAKLRIEDLKKGA